MLGASFHFYLFNGTLRKFQDFGGPGDGLELWRVFMSTFEHPQVLRPFCRLVPISLPMPNYHHFAETDSIGPETEPGSFEIELGVHRIHATLDTGLQIMLRSLVALTRGADGSWLTLSPEHSSSYRVPPPTRLHAFLPLVLFCERGVSSYCERFSSKET